MVNAISACLNKYAVFTGRATRSEYWYFVLFLIIVAILSNFISILMGSELAGLIIQVIFWIPSLSVSIRRMHDVDKSGWFILVPIYSFILTIRESTVGPNRFGPQEY
jgi:uncharacterized membrane protein YhaH (DUF805 family)